MAATDLDAGAAGACGVRVGSSVSERPIDLDFRISNFLVIPCYGSWCYTFRLAHRYLSVEDVR